MAEQEQDRGASPTQEQADRMTAVAARIHNAVLKAVDGMPDMREQLCAFEVGTANALATLLEHVEAQEAAKLIETAASGIASAARWSRFGEPS